MLELLANNIGQIVTAILGAAAVYGGIRADLRAMRASIERAQRQIDDHLQYHIKGG